MQDNVENTERRIGIEFSNKNILKEALTHRSFLNENPSWQVSHNERLEYLGDAVAELIVTEFLYSLYPDKQEGELTSFRAALVNYQMMALVAREVMLEQSLFLSKGEMKDTGRARDVILANAFEALVGAIYLDRGYDVTRDFLSKFLLPKLDGVLKDKLYKDPKSLLQEIIQEKEKITPSYKVLKEHGPDHKRVFTVGVFFDERRVAEGEGASKQDAENEAARMALKIISP